MKKWIPSLCICFLSFLISCGHNKNSHADSASDSGSNNANVINDALAIPETRSTVNPNPVQEFKEKTDNPLNDWYFSVKLYETPQTFHYLLKMKFEEVEGEDTIRLPNFGIEPKPVLKKGGSKYSCIIGFLDSKGQFREYKLVHVENGSDLKLTTLKHYSIYSYQQ